MASTPPFRYIDGVKWAEISRGRGRAVLCRENEYDLFKALEKTAKTDYHSLYLHKQVTGLSSDIGGLNNLISKFTTLKRKLKLEGGEIDYKIRGGDVLLTGLTIDFGYRDKNIGAMGLYSVKNNADERYPAKTTKMIQSEHAAINGLSASLTKASGLMPAFINEGYKEQPLDKNAEYTLFYNSYHGIAEADWKCVQDSTGLRGGSRAARQLAAAIEMAAEQKRKVNWTVHERGCAIFKQALRLVAGGHNYSNQTVFYANPVINLELIDEHRKRLGMNLAKDGYIFNEWSVHQGMLAGNLISDVGMQWRQMDNKGEAVARAVKHGGKAAAVAGLQAAPAIWATAGWAVSLLAILGPNLFSSYTNRGVIKSNGDMLNHYIFKRGNA